MTEANVPAVPREAINYFRQYGQTASMNNIRGSLLKFAKGDWLMGQDEEEVKAGRQFVVVMNELQIGWIKWSDNKPVAQILGKLVDGFVPPKREELGDHDETLWDTDSQGKERDPWQFTNVSLLRNPGTSGADENDIFTFSTSSRGGINCVGDLCKAYGDMMREKPDGNPVVVLEQTSYKHPNAEYGRIKKPVLRIVGWEDTNAPAKIEAPAEEVAPKKRGRK
jgi:hypothetical protein